MTAVTATVSTSPVLAIRKLTTGCSSYPNYNANTSTAGPFNLIATSTSSPFLDDKKAAIAPFTTNGIDSYGFINIPKRATSYTPSITLSCQNSTLHFSLSSPSFTLPPAQPIPLFVTKDENWHSSLGYGNYLGRGIPVETYDHVYVNGSTKVEGVYLGAEGNTRWRFKFNWGGNAGEYYLVRLDEEAEGTLDRRQDGGPGVFPPIDDRDFVGFLKVVGVA
ncbi:hypothetical protein BU24DRAFT_468256 [Aaosphaeria arxii CBS 175.79]|uniref:Uncharacterized protein n=1 Tax=Aaosphaeria arxii CBS 175.79 TaxID=1450172 RepID=A0A6A5X8N8_9PLEO|nr:uncharacterized protein BU24DRAFT_468256 [Aaosphaeria arxii CBS 175.79]KAF2009281.1 hypothetical protein BU24DRAFT_468256 [Aaosphaeria arxii CBS 175.79]